MGGNKSSEMGGNKGKQTLADFVYWTASIAMKNFLRLLRFRSSSIRVLLLLVSATTFSVIFFSRVKPFSNHRGLLTDKEPRIGEGESRAISPKP